MSYSFHMPCLTSHLGASQVGQGESMEARRLQGFTEFISHHLSDHLNLPSQPVLFLLSWLKVIAPELVSFCQSSWV